MVWELAEDEVHCWFFTPGQWAAAEELVADLSPQERERAARFLFDRGRVEYTVCRGVLRRLLARYGGGSAAQLQFVYSPRGKPALRPDQNPLRLQFNLAHSSGAAVIAVTRNHPVGVDVERVRPVADLEGLLRLCFTLEEQSELRSLPEPEQLRAFFAGWVRKEAFLKATGEGLSQPLTSFAVSLAPGGPPRVLRVGDDRTAGDHWTLRDLTRDNAHAAAVAVCRPDVVVLVRDLSGALLGLPHSGDLDLSRQATL
jgi:4'-phosphopantetheinyl transferase